MFIPVSPTPVMGWPSFPADKTLPASAAASSATPVTYNPIAHTAYTEDHKKQNRRDDSTIFTSVHCRATRADIMAMIRGTAHPRVTVNRPGSFLQAPIPPPRMVYLHAVVGSQSTTRSIILILPLMTSATGAVNAITGPPQLHSTRGCRAPRQILVVADLSASRLMVHSIDEFSLSIQERLTDATGHDHHDSSNVIPNVLWTYKRDGIPDSTSFSSAW